jgi:hypothetical protein
MLSMKPLNNEVLKALKMAGWTPARDETGIEHVFSRLMGEKWLPVAAPFLRRFGGLDIAHKLCVWDMPFSHHDLITQNEARFAEVVNSKVIPIATSNYMGDGGVLWMDEKGQLYVADSEGIVFVGIDEAEAFEVLLLGGARPEPPIELCHNLAKNYEWNLA